MMTFAAEGLDLPTELILKLSLELDPPTLHRLSQGRPMLCRLLTDARFQSRYLSNKQRLIDDPSMLIYTAWWIDRAWARNLYEGMTLYGRLKTIDGLLETSQIEIGSIKCVVLDLARRERAADAKLRDPSYGLFHRHLKWRLIKAGMIKGRGAS